MNSGRIARPRPPIAMSRIASPLFTTMRLCMTTEPGSPPGFCRLELPEPSRMHVGVVDALERPQVVDGRGQAPRLRVGRAAADHPSADGRAFGRSGSNPGDARCGSPCRSRCRRGRGPCRRGRRQLQFGNSRESRQAPVQGISCQSHWRRDPKPAPQLTGSASRPARSSRQTRAPERASSRTRPIPARSGRRGASSGGRVLRRRHSRDSPIRLLMTDLETFRRAAAAVMPPASTTCRKVTTSSKRHLIVR